jgi:hypothetical protein
MPFYSDDFSEFNFFKPGIASTNLKISAVSKTFDLSVPSGLKGLPGKISLHSSRHLHKKLFPARRHYQAVFGLG